MKMNVDGDDAPADALAPEPSVDADPERKASVEELERRRIGLLYHFMARFETNVSVVDLSSASRK